MTAKPVVREIAWSETVFCTMYRHCMYYVCVEEKKKSKNS